MKYTEETLIDAVACNDTVSGVLRTLGIPQSGGHHSHIKKRIELFGIDTTHFVGQKSNRGKTPPNRKTAQEVLIILPIGSNRAKAYRLRRALIEIGRPHECAKCPIADLWNGLPLVLEVDHINENWLDNRAENLQFLCPNCHSQKTLGAVAQRQRRMA